uniref:NADH-ubiquinone oxidoreductase chain 6 n=1 Tax=Paraleuctra cercia TaxID=2778005 RepID=A0A7L8ZU12_9NEOP|nr:NADH dehydrogenase subunit 6 [Paraleuctra cercia]QOI73895.1 NADH dehydrogenase subunit 6 [Paraleuctra cercia]
MLTSVSTFITLSFIQMNHPLAMGLMLLLQTLIVCLITGLISQTFWFSYILFLVFVGGLLVLFIYVTSLASNEMFTMSAKPMLIGSMMISITGLIYMISDPSLFSMEVFTSDTSYFHSITTLNMNTTTLLKLYNQPTGLLTTALILYLFLTLIAVVKITSIFQGPLRQKN